MTANADETASTVFLEAIYFAGGIRTALYGSAGRPSWLPAMENVGLHNDVYLTTGQYAVELSRLEFADGQRPNSGVTWLGIYGHASDVYGDRGNYCGVGIWCLEGLVVDTERTLAALLQLLGLLHESLPEAGSHNLGGEFSNNCLKALAWMQNNGVVLGSLKSQVGISYAGSYQSSRVYVRLDEELDQRVIGKLASAIDCLCLTDIDLRASSVLFVAGDESSIDGQVSSAKCFASIADLPGCSRPPFSLVKALFETTAASESAMADLNANAALAMEKTRALQEVRDRLEAELKDAHQMLDQVTQTAAPEASLIPPLPHQFWDELERRFRAVATESRPLAKDGSKATLNFGIDGGKEGPSNLLAVVNAKLDRLEQSMASLTRKEFFVPRETVDEGQSSKHIPWTWVAMSCLAGAVVTALGALIAKSL